ncbi:MAG: cyclic nucleotide-binding domain-containing protein [Reichenbachiella sp.]
MYNPFKKKYSEEEKDFFNFLSGISHFKSLKQDELLLFKPHMYLRKYKQDEVAFFSTDPSHALYIVKSGEIALSMNIKDNFEKLSTVTGGYSFGDNAFLEDTKRIYNAIVSSEQAELYVIPQINLFEILDTHPEIKAKIMTSIATMYNEYTARVFKKYKSNLGFFELENVYRENL